MKSILSAKVSCALFPNLLHAGMIACNGCMLGHCFQIFIGFEGGKGFAVYAGMVLLFNPWFAIPIIILGILLIVILNTWVAAPMLASILFSDLIAINGGDKVVFQLAIVASTILVFMHHDNINKAIAKKDRYSTKDFLTKLIFKSDH